MTIIVSFLGCAHGGNREGRLYFAAVSLCIVFGMIIVCGASSQSAIAQEQLAPNHLPRASGRNTKLAALEFSVAKSGDVLLLPVTIAHDVKLFVVDTGASYSIFDKSLRPALGDKKDSTKIITPDGPLSIDLYAAPVARIGSLFFATDSLVSVADFEALREEYGYEIYGVVGMDYLSHYVCRIDFDNGTFQLLESADLVSGRRIPIVYRRRGLPYIFGAMTTGAKELMGFQVDTGLLEHSACVGSEVFTLLVNRGGIKDVSETRTWTLAGERGWRVGTAKSLAIEGFSHSDLTVSEGNYNALGLSYLARFVVTFDFPNGVMYLDKGKRFDAREARDLSGMDIVKRHNTIEVASVAEGGAAEDARIEAGDVMLKCGKLDSRDATLFELRQELSKDGEEIEIELLRKGIKRRVTIKLDSKAANRR